ncbi:MAG: hypothetical protein WA667_02445, partial [Candidatus Nitrosopolaris sp.]
MSIQFISWWNANDRRRYCKEGNCIYRFLVNFLSSSELSAVEECWRQGKDTLLVSKYYPSFTNLKAAITNYYRKKRFNLN